MKNMADIQTRFHSELEQWFIKQVRDEYSDYYLYYLPTTPEHDGGFSFCKDKPANPDVLLGWNQPVCKGSTIEQNFNAYIPILRRLPILEY